jgi:hypothetical protein
MDDVGRNWEQQQRNNVNNKKMLSPSPIYTLKQVEEKKSFLSSPIISLSNEDSRSKILKMQAWIFYPRHEKMKDYPLCYQNLVCLPTPCFFSLRISGRDSIKGALKFLDFRMLLGRIIKQRFRNNFKICLTFIFIKKNYRKIIVGFYN